MSLSRKKKKATCPIIASRREERKQAKLAKKQLNMQRHENKCKTTAPPAPHTKSEPPVPVLRPKKKGPDAPQKQNKKREEEMRKQRLKQVRQQLKADDKMIKQMEKKLKLNRRKGRTSIPKSFYAEGLGDILDLVDKRVDPDHDLLVEKESPATDEEEMDELDVDSDADDQEEEDSHLSDGDIDQEIEFDVEEDDADISDDADEEEEKDEDDVVAAHASPQSVTEKPEPLDETLLRRIRGQLNRITSSNLPSISTFIEKMYQNNSLFHMNESICRCIESLLVIEVSLSPAKLVTEMCLLLASLHANIGEEVGGHAIHYFVRAFKTQLDANMMSMDSKRMDNIVSILCNLYAVCLVDCGLFYELTGEIVSCFDEKSIELLLFILTSVGFLMRKDSPDRMKTLIQSIQTKARQSPDVVSKRTEFMLQTLAEIKNNNILKVTSKASSIVSPIDRDEVKAILKNCLKRSAKVSAIPATLQQALSSNRWWIKVGPGLIENQQNREDKQEQKAVQEKREKYEFSLESEAEEKLCRRLRLNTTPLRRSLFKALISSSDYIEAADRLASLCRKNQCIEAANVVIQVAIHETKSFNPFYLHVLKRLSSFDRQYKISIFYAMRDRLPDVQSFSEAKKQTFARLMFHLTKEKVISLSVVKSLDFASLTESLADFLKQLLTLVTSDSGMREMFDRIPKKDHMLLTSLRLFISCFMDQSAESSLGRDLITARIRMKH